LDYSLIALNLAVPFKLASTDLEHDHIELYAESHQAWLETFLDLKNGVPKADTYRRTFERINPDELQEGFLGWVKQIVEAKGAQVIPIDGKTLKGS
jgi:hypothetical protein